MNAERFNEIVEDRCQTLKLTLASKATEYAFGDRLSNFKKIAAFRDIHPEEALMGLVVKHIVALDDYIGDLALERCQPSSAWDEKIGDVINYMILLEALLDERFAAQKETS